MASEKHKALVKKLLDWFGPGLYENAFHKTLATHVRQDDLEDLDANTLQQAFPFRPDAWTIEWLDNGVRKLICYEVSVSTKLMTGNKLEKYVSAWYAADCSMGFDLELWEVDEHGVVREVSLPACWYLGLDNKPLQPMYSGEHFVLP